MADWWDWTGEAGPWESNAAPDLWGGGGGGVGADYSSGGGSYYDADLSGGNPWMGSTYQGGQGDFPGGGLSLEQQVAQAIAQRPDLYGSSVSEGAGGGSSFWGSLGKLLLGGGQAAAGAVGGGGGGGLLGPLLSSLGSLGGGAIGSNAANEAARLQSQALNRGIDLQTAQWLQQQQNLAPYLQAGQQGLSTLQGLAGREQPGLPGATPGVNGANYGLPSAAPGWMPQTFTGPQAVNAGDYRWTPGQGPQAGDYRYAPGQTPDATNYRYTPGAVPTLSGQELLANDPGVQFRMDEGRKALEASAAARGGLLSGPTLAALQRQGQELGSQEYGQAWNRASQQAQLREGWQQTATAQNFGQAMSAAQLREQVNQYATQQGWTQAQAEAVFREQMGQQASQQGWNQALAGQQNQFTQGLQAQQWNQRQAQQYETDLYGRTLEQSKLRYGQDVTQNATDYDRQQARYRQQLAQYLLPWEQQNALAGYGAKATGQFGEEGAYVTRNIASVLGQLGTAQAGGATNQANSWLNALSGVNKGVQGYFSNNAYEQGRQSVLSGLNA